MPVAKRCPAAKILACEINPVLANHLRQNLDRAGINGQVQVVRDAAERVLSDLTDKKGKRLDYIVSGIPLGNTSRRKTVALLQPTTDGNGSAVTQRVLAVGPAASQIAIKQLGTNGGGFFNTNSAHPFENPTPLSNLLEMVAILLLPVALCYTFGVMVNDTRQGWALLAAMLVIFVVLCGRQSFP